MEDVELVLHNQLKLMIVSCSYWTPHFSQRPILAISGLSMWPTQWPSRLLPAWTATGARARTSAPGVCGRCAERSRFTLWLWRYAAIKGASCWPEPLKTISQEFTIMNVVIIQVFNQWWCEFGIHRWICDNFNWRFFLIIFWLVYLREVYDMNWIFSY